MLALACTAHLPPAPEPAAPPPAVAEVSAQTITVAQEQAPEEVQPVVQPVATRPALPPAISSTPTVLSTAVLLLVAGFALRVRGERAPPTV